MTVAPEMTFQATDLARSTREVMTAAGTPSGAVIRDKDGRSFLLAPAATVSRDRYVLEGLRSAVRVLRLLTLDAFHGEPLLYGDLAWLADLPENDQREFCWEYIKALETISVIGVEGVEDLLYAWQQTARAWADPEIRDQLTAELSAPLEA